MSHPLSQGSPGQVWARELAGENHKIPPGTTHHPVPDDQPQPSRTSCGLLLVDHPGQRTPELHPRYPPGFDQQNPVLCSRGSRVCPESQGQPVMAAGAYHSNYWTLFLQGRTQGQTKLAVPHRPFTGMIGHPYPREKGACPKCVCRSIHIADSLRKQGLSRTATPSGPTALLTCGTDSSPTC